MGGGDEGERRLVSVIEDVYGVIGSATAWNALAAKIAETFNSPSCLVKAADLQGGGRGFGGTTENFTAQFWSDYENHYYAQDQWLAASLRRPNEVIIGHLDVPEDWYQKSDFYNDFCSRAGLHHVLAATVPLQGNMVGIVSVHRPKTAPRFGEHDRRGLARLLPHIARAIRLTRMLASLSLQQQASLDALDRADTAVVALARNGLILSTNSAAERLLKQGIGLCAINGRLTGTSGKVTGRLVALIHAATDPRFSATSALVRGGISISRGEGRLPLTALIVPFRPLLPASTSPMASALAFISDPEGASIATDLLQDLFGLTPAQAIVARCLADGDSLDMIAQKLRISLHTARGHLKAIFAKTETSRQPQLVALLLRSAATLGRP